MSTAYIVLMLQSPGCVESKDRRIIKAGKTTKTILSNHQPPPVAALDHVTLPFTWKPPEMATSPPPWATCCKFNTNHWLEKGNCTQWMSALDQAFCPCLSLAQWHRKYTLSINYRVSLEWCPCHMESTAHCLYLGRMNPGPSEMFTVPFICGLNRKIAIMHSPDGERCLKGRLAILGTVLISFSIRLFGYFSYRRSRKSWRTEFLSSAVSKKWHLFKGFQSC